MTDPSLTSSLPPHLPPPPTQPQQKTQQQIPQVKVMRLALTRAGPFSTAAASRGALLTLPTVFETIHAGQMLKCLARVLYAPRNCKVIAKLEQGKGQHSQEVGTATGEGVLDLLVKGRLQASGPHELVLSCTTKEGTEILKKVYKIDVSPSFILETPPRVTFVKEKIWVKFQVKNVSKEMHARITSVDFICDKGISLAYSSYTGDNIETCYIYPDEAQSFVFFLSREAATSEQTSLGRLKLGWNTGLGEESELVFPNLRIDRVPVTGPQQFQLEDPSKTTLEVGKAVPVLVSSTGLDDDSLSDFVEHRKQELAASAQEEYSFLIHGPKQLLNGGKSFIIPTRTGVFADVSALFGFREKISTFVVSSGNDIPKADGLPEKIQSPNLRQFLTEELVQDYNVTSMSPSITRNPLPINVEEVENAAEEFGDQAEIDLTGNNNNSADYTQDVAFPLDENVLPAVVKTFRERSISSELREELGIPIEEATGNITQDLQEELEKFA